MAAATVVSLTSWGQVPAELAYQGRVLRADGTPLSGPQTIRFEVFADEVSTTSLWSEQQTLGLSDGYYSTALGRSTTGGVPTTVFDGTVRFLEVTVNGEKLTPRQRISSVAYAFRSDHARTVVAGGTVNTTSVSINGMQVIDSSGRLTGSAVPLAGTGLTYTAATSTYAVDFGADAGLVCEGNDPRLSNARPPTGTASGDLSGAYPDPTVDGLLGRPLGGAAPVAGDVLMYDGAQWVPQARVIKTSGGAGVITDGGSVSLMPCGANEALRTGADGGWTCAPLPSDLTDIGGLPLQSGTANLLSTATRTFNKGTYLVFYYNCLNAASTSYYVQWTAQSVSGSITTGYGNSNFNELKEFSQVPFVLQVRSATANVRFVVWNPAAPAETISHTTSPCGAFNWTQLGL